MSNILIDESLLVKSRGSKRRADQSINQTDDQTNEANILVIDPKRPKQPKPSNQPTAKQLSKAEARKLAKLAEAKEKKARLASIYQGLEQSRLTPQQQSLLSSSGEIGKKVTHRQRVAQLVREEKAGIHSAPDSKDTVAREIARLKEHQSSDLSVRDLLSRRRKASKKAAPVGSSLVNSFGLDPNRWRSRANDEGSIKFDTHRTITYGSDEEEEDEDDDDDDDMSMSESDDDHRAPEEETELSRAIKAASSGGKDEADENYDDESDDDSSAMPAPAPKRDGMFSVAFDVIAASNRPKRKRVALMIPGQKPAEPEPQPEREIEEDDDDQSMDENDDDEDAEASDDDEEAEHDADKNEDEDGEDEDNDDDEQVAETDSVDASKPQVLQTVRGKARVEPAKPDRIAQILAAQGHIAEAGKFARSNRAPLVRIPLAPGAKAYEAKEDDIRVSFNDERLGESGPGGMEELRTRTKGQSIIETREQNSDDKPRLYTRKLLSAKKGGAPSYVAYSNRLPDIQQSRLSLPITSHEQEIVEALSVHDVLIIQGETGSGKTTQVPQFLLENGFTFGQRVGMIGITQPRRVAAISTAQRVAQELNLPGDRPKNYKFDATAVRAHIEADRAARAARGEPLETGELDVYDPYNTVGYQVRYDSKASQTTRIKFMTDGILLREVSVDFLLRGYSVICVDEAHERGRNTDVLIGLLTRAVQMRSKLFKRYQAQLALNNGVDTTPDAVVDSDGRPIVRSLLKLLIMSATLRTEDFLSSTRLFAADAKPRVLTIPARQFPVTVHFNRSTPVDNYLPALLAKVVRMHMKLPDGGILVFVTGKDEIEYLCEKITKCWQEREKRKNKIKLLQDKEKDDKSNDQSSDDDSDAEEDTRTEEEKAFDLGDEKSKKSSGDLESQSAVDSEALAQADIDRLFSDPTSKQTLAPYCLPLYSLLPSHLQMRVFEPPPAGHRLIVIATNIAETSLTIPSISYVLDSGREKRKVWDRVTGCSHFVVDWISAASAEQRKGRAGRTGPGHVYRLYSAAVFDQQFPPHNPPEILREPIESTVLQMKAMGIANIDTFPFPTPPDRHQIKAAELSLTQLGALSPNVSRSITALGSTLSLFPVMPRYAKMLVLAHQGNCLPYVIAIVAALSVEQILLKMKMSEDQSDDDGSDDDYDDDDRSNNQTFKKGTAAAREREAKKAKRKRLYDALAAARQRWSNPDSDLLTYLRIIGGYEFAVSKAQNHASTKSINQSLKKKYATDFCAQNFIRMKAMEEIELLRKQLSSIAVSVLTGRDESASESAEESRGSGDVEAEEDALFNQSKMQTKHAAVIQQLSSPMQPPSAAQTRLIRQLMTAGLIDRVARKLSEDERRVLMEKQTAGSADWTNAYETLNSPHPAFIHPSSVLFPTSSQPRYLVYHSLQVNQSLKQYMHDCTMIEEETLVTIGAEAGLLSWSAFLDEPKPLFNAQLDRVEGFKKATLGPKRWELKPQRRPWTDTDNQRHEYLHFARLLLEGAIFESFKKLLPFYCAKPHHLTQPGATVRQVLQAPVTKLMNQSIKTRAQLVKIWKKDPQFLRGEIELWMQPIALPKLAASWPPK